MRSKFKALRGPESLEARRLLAAIPVYSTGIDDNGSLVSGGQPEPHFRLIASPKPTYQATVVAGVASVYFPNDAYSKWIGPSADSFGVQDGGDYRYREAFSLIGFDPSTAVLNGQLASDNGCEVLLNGVATGVEIAAEDQQAFTELHPFTISSGFLPGLNTIEVVVNNGYSATGMRLQLSGTADPARTPSPRLTSAVLTGSTIAVGGSLDAAPSTNYRIDFYASPTAVPTGATFRSSPILSTNVASGPSGHATIGAQVPSLVPAGQYLLATASVAGGVISVPSAAQLITSGADVAVAIVGAPKGVKVGQDLTITYMIANSGPSPATGATLVAAMPGGAALLAASASRGSIESGGGGLVLTIPSLEPGGTATLTVKLHTLAAGELPLSAGVAAAGVPDPDATNNAAATSVRITSKNKTSPIGLAGPIVLGARVLDPRGRQPRLAFTFSEPLDAVRAASVENYRLIDAGPDGRFQSRDDRTIAIFAIQLDPTGTVVTLTTSRPLNARHRYQITVTPSGILDRAGRPLNSGSSGVPTGPFRATFRGDGKRLS